MGDPERGTAWEESILLSPPGVQLICLSATVPNLDEVADWIRAAHGDLTAILHDTRAVPLEHRYFVDGKAHVIVDADGRRRASFRGVGGELARRISRPGQLGRGSQPGPGPTTSPTSRPRAMPGGPATSRASVERPSRGRCCAPWRSESLTPAIYFQFSRRACEEAAESCIALGTVPHGMDLVQEAKQRLVRPLAGGPRAAPDRAAVPAAAARGRRPPRRPAAGRQDAGRGAVPVGPAALRLRHRHAGAGHQHAGPDGRDRRDVEVGRPPASPADAERVPPDDRTGRPARHRRARRLGDPLLAVGQLRADAEHRHGRPAAARKRVQAELQHGDEPLATARRPGAAGRPVRPQLPALPAGRAAARPGLGARRAEAPLRAAGRARRAATRRPGSWPASWPRPRRCWTRPTGRRARRPGRWCPASGRCWSGSAT